MIWLILATAVTTLVGEQAFGRKESSVFKLVGNEALVERKKLGGLGCLKKTTPGLTVSYPSDANAHFTEIHDAFAAEMEKAGEPLHEFKAKQRCAAGYCGPWIENHWIDRFQQLAGKDANLSSTFGPFIPLLLPWTDIWVYGGRGKHWKSMGRRYSYPPFFVPFLERKLRKSVLYITVNQNDEGITGKHELLMEAFPNILVLSSGGYGHVPIPLLKQTEPLAATIAMQDRKYLTSYVGSFGNAPFNLRRDMLSSMAGLNSTHRACTFYGGGWREAMRMSKTSLVPRGFGRTAYHLVEAIQMGLVPIYVYHMTPWLPYRRLYEKHGLLTSVDELPSMFDRLLQMSDAELHAKERLAARLIDSHYSYNGTLDQISKFMVGAPNDLLCQRLPSTVRGSEKEVAMRDARGRRLGTAYEQEVLKHRRNGMLCEMRNASSFE
jgi:hypothetical protein